MKRPATASPASVSMIGEDDELRCRDSGHSFSARRPRMQPKRNQRKVLLLGMSYPHIEEQMEEEGYSMEILDTRKLGVDLIVELVRRRILTEMDGRDYARILAMQEQHGVQAYTVSQEQGAIYWNERHVEANFCRHNFVAGLQRSFGENVKFHQVVLDYFWIPKGVWMATHWKPTFFRSTLVDLLDVLHHQGSIWLPFCYHCCKELVAHLDVLSEYYSISFAQRHDLDSNLLWSGTQGIDPVVMQEDLGKRIDQEEIYCTFGPSDVSQAMDDNRVRKSDVVRVLRRIEDFDTVRFIVLRPGRGGFVNLPPVEAIVNGYDSLVGAYKADDGTVTTTTEEMTEEEESEEEDEIEEGGEDEEDLEVEEQVVEKEEENVEPLVLPPTVYMVAKDLKTYRELHGRDMYLNWVYRVNAIKREWDKSSVMKMIMGKQCDPADVVDHWGLESRVPLTYNAIYESRNNYRFGKKNTHESYTQEDGLPWMNQYPRAEPVDLDAVTAAIRREIRLDKRNRQRHVEQRLFERPSMLPDSPARKKARRMRELAGQEEEDKKGWVYNE